MSRPKQPEEHDSIMVRPPMSVADVLRELAGNSNDGKGMSVNRYCVAVLTSAAESGILVNERTIFDMSAPLAMVADRADEEPLTKNGDKKKVNYG